MEATWPLALSCARLEALDWPPGDGAGILEARHYIADTEEYWEPGRPKKWKCIECRSTVCNVGVGFTGYDDDPTGIKWIYTGERCTTCGIFGSFADWKVAQSDALELLEKA